MALVINEGPLSGHPDAVYTPTFQASAQPMRICVSGNFDSPDSYRPDGYVVVQYQMQNGEWIDARDMSFEFADTGTFRLSPGQLGRVKISGCKAVHVEIHNEEAPND